MDFRKDPSNKQYFDKDMLFHYTSLETALEFILSDKQLKFSSFKRVDDPCEKGIRNISVNWSSTDNIDETKIDSVHYHNLINNIRLNESKLLCFSKNARDIDISGSKVLDLDKYYRTGFFKPRMWAQYGQKNRGICIAFSRESMVQEVKEQYPYSKFYRGEIKYTDSIQETRKAYHLQANTNLINDFRNFFIDSHLSTYRNEFFFTKNTDWKDENEYRLLLINESNECYLNIEKSIRAIFCGIDFPSAYMSSLKNLVRFMDIDIFRLVINDGIPHVYKV